MTIPVSPHGSGMSLPSAGSKTAEIRQQPESFEVGKKFEQMLWAEMLTHAGLEKAFTQSGGEAASAFSRYIVEAISKDIAEKHPLGFAEAAGASLKAPDTAEQS